MPSRRSRPHRGGKEHRFTPPQDPARKRRDEHQRVAVPSHWHRSRTTNVAHHRARTNGQPPPNGNLRARVDGVCSSQYTGGERVLHRRIFQPSDGPWHRQPAQDSQTAFNMRKAIALPLSARNRIAAVKSRSFGRDHRRSTSPPSAPKA